MGHQCREHPVLRLPELLALCSRADQDLKRLSELSGLRHFEGGSFRGWHHHVTMVSAAHAFGLLGRASGTDGWQSP
ncbi:hypothetical protein ACIQJT_34950 [Streptomyces sp. NPDC091972]|uniref:hypothetical protein n=1 Tax=Streptomyces sp. NPDC091972 TaxID=3366007 RepID=UPI0037FC637F